jgi:hypothetical protein
MLNSGEKVVAESMEKQRLDELAEILWILARDPHPNQSYTVKSLTAVLRHFFHDINEARVLGHLRRLKAAGLFTIEARGEYGEPHIVSLMHARK